jgi:hypothetical protein
MVPGVPDAYDLLGVYTPGASFEMYGDGAAKLLRGGEDLYLNCNIHYQSTGKPEKDQSRIAFWFQAQPPKYHLVRVNGAGESLLANGIELPADGPLEKAEGNSAAIPPIPPNTGNYEVTGMTAYTHPVIVYQFHPHAHFRGKDFTYSVVYGDGREQTVLSLPKYDFHWQMAYDLTTPLELPAGSKLVVTAHYDNSANNANKPASDKEAHFLGSGNQSWDEMFTPFIQYAVAGPNTMDIVEVNGCLAQGPIGVWRLVDASDPVVSKTQARHSANREYQLLGVRFFGPGGRVAREAVVRGVLIAGAGESRINVTSLRTTGPACVK